MLDAIDGLDADVTTAGRASLAGFYCVPGKGKGIGGIVFEDLRASIGGDRVIDEADVSAAKPKSPAETGASTYRAVFRRKPDTYRV